MLADALSGLVVLDFGQLIAGPVCGMYLADMGATVVKIEPASGELARQLPSVEPTGESLTVLTSNRGKLGFAINLKHADAATVIRRMVAQSDVLIENFRPGVTNRLGIDHAALSAVNPRLITCSLSAYGQTGPWRDRPGVDGVLQAVTGLMAGLGHPGDAPSKAPLPLADMAGALYATIAILAAVRQRDTTGQGAHLDVSLFNGVLMLQQLGLANFLSSGDLPGRLGSAAPYAAPNEAFATNDGWIMVVAYQADRWPRFCEALGLPMLANDPRFLTNAGRVAERAALNDAVAQVFQSRSSSQWRAIFQAADIMAEPIANYAEVASSVAYREAGIEISVDAMTDKPIRMPGFAVAGPCLPPSRSTPRVGEHSRALLQRFGFTSTEIDEMIEREIVFEGGAR